MNTAETTYPMGPGTATAHALHKPLVTVLAAGTGLSVATLYYSQPMLGALVPDLHVDTQSIGLVPTLTQLGYALGILFLAPLGDRHDRRNIILIKASLLVLALLAAGLAPSLPVLLVASLAIGLFATLAQDIVPAAAAMAHERSRGQVVGTVMTGLFLGILLSRVISGWVAQTWGWRSMFVMAAVSVAIIGAAVWRALPHLSPTTRLSYGALLHSLAALLQRHGALRRAALAQGLLAIGFSAFWSTLAVMLHSRFHMGSAVAGTFGLAGAAGALAAPLAGRLADRRGPAIVTRVGTALAALSFAAMSFAPLLPTSAQMWLLGIGTVGFDLGVQATLVAHQAIVYGIDPDARSRLNAVLFVGMFTGMATGALAGSVVFAHWGWSAVTGMAVLTSLAAWGVRSWPDRRAH